MATLNPTRVFVCETGFDDNRYGETFCFTLSIHKRAGYFVLPQEQRKISHEKSLVTVLHFSQS